MARADLACECERLWFLGYKDQAYEVLDTLNKWEAGGKGLVSFSDMDETDLKAWYYVLRVVLEEE